MKITVSILIIFISAIILSFGCGGDGEYGPGKSEGVCYEDGTCDYGLSCNSDDICRASIVQPSDENTTYDNSCSLDEECDDSYECIDEECVEIEDGY